MLKSSFYLTVFSVFVATTAAFAQDRNPRGYVSTGLGPTYLLNADKVHTGLQLNLLEVGYEVWKGFGAVASWGGGAYAYEDEYQYFDGTNWHPFPVDVQVGYGLLMIGPMYSQRVGDNASVDLKWRIGRYVYDDKIESVAIAATNHNTSLGYMISGSYQYRFSDWWTAFASLDYGTNRADFDLDKYASMSTLALTVGIGMRF